MVHGIMKEVLMTGTSFMSDEALFVQFLNWQVSQENASLLRRFSANGMRNVPKDKVHRISLLASRELCQLSFICGNDQGCNGGTRVHLREVDSAK